jgi:hypothetical protein
VAVDRPARPYSPPDGHKPRGNRAEAKINESLVLSFADAAGESALKYLRSITIEYVNGPGFDPNALMHLEGARWLVGVIERRIHDGKEKKPHV